nr:hypothetical protein [Tanacetum cinerariifolium]
MTAEEHIVVQRESNARTTLRQSIPDDYVADFHYMDDARDIWNAVKASASKKMSYGDSPGYSSNTTYSASSNSKTGSHRSSNVLGDVLQSFVVDTEPEQQLAYEDFEQIEKLDLEEMDLKWQMAMLSVRVHKFEQKAGRKIDFDKKESARFNKKKIGKKEEDSKALITVDTLVDWTYHDDESTEVITAKEFGMIAGCDSEDAIKEGAAKIYNLITGANSEEANIAGDAREFALTGVTSELTLEDKIRVMSIELENTSNLLKHSEIINADFETAKKDLQTKLDNHLVQTEKWRNSSKNLFRLIDSFMSVRTKVGRPIFHRFAKTDSMKVVPPPLSGDYTSLSDHIDLDESQMSYGTNSSTSCDSKSMSNDFVSCDDSNKSSEVNTNDFTSSDSSVKSSEHQPNDSTSCASTSSDLPSFSCNSSDKNEHTSRTFCNKNGYFNKKAGHFRKHASSVSKLCFVCGSATHLIKDCDFHEKQMANKTVGIGVGHVYNRNKVNYQNQFVPQAVLLRTGKVNIPHVRPQPVPTGKPKVSAPVPTGKPKVSTPVPTGKPKVSTPVPTGRPNRPSPFPTDRGFSPSLISGWWSSTARPMPHLINPTRSYFQTYTPYVPTMSYNHMKYGGDRWATLVKPSAGTYGPYRNLFSGCRCWLTTTQQMVFNSPCLTDKKELIHHEVRLWYVVSTGKVIVATGSSFGQSSSSDDIVFSNGPSKALLKWYDDATDEDIEEFMFSKSGGKKVQRPKNPTPTVIVKIPIPIKNCVLRLSNVKPWDCIVKKSFGVKKPGS